jgi:hypothetical protein
MMATLVRLHGRKKSGQGGKERRKMEEGKRETGNFVYLVMEEDPPEAASPEVASFTDADADIGVLF